ncbi:MAG TPA: hypothetical protein VK733_00195, partial [Gemmatimonadaceae bacterium]|nr:hypothetical protein [Gemmatimonadaceae bacterium]
MPFTSIHGRSASRAILGAVYAVLLPMLLGALARPMFAQLTALPKNAPYQAVIGSNNEVFTIQYVGSQSPTANLTISCTGVIASCVFAANNQQTLNGVSMPNPFGVLALLLEQVNFTTSGGGTGTVKLKVATTNPTANDSAYINVTVPIVKTVTVTVSPKTVLGATPGQQYTATFSVKNTGNVSNTFGFAATCRGPVPATCGNPSLSSATLAMGEDTTVTLNWTAASSATGSGWVSMTADDGNGAAGMDTQTLSEYGAGLDVVDVNPGPSFSRANCLSVAVGPRAASECGTLRIVHPLPSVKSYNKVHTPTLIYNARLASGTPNIGANLTVPGSMALDSVEGRLLVVEHGTSNTYPLAPELWHGSDWQTTGAQKTRRLQLTFFNSGFTPDLYDITFYTKRIHGTSVLVQDSAKAQEIIANWYTSPFGMGWWLAGLERTRFTPDSNIVWFGGDGSTQLYLRNGTNVWKPDTAGGSPYYVAGRDSITYPFGASHLFVRHAPHGVQVTFDSGGQHIQTIDRLGHATTFTYNSNGTLAKLTVEEPYPYDTALYYAFKYDANGTLDTVLAPAAGRGANAARRVVAFVNSQHAPSATEGHDAIIDPDGDTVRFVYDSAGGTQMLITARIDKRHSTTAFGYAGMPFDLYTSEIEMQQGAGHDIMHEFFPYNNFGQALPWLAYGSTQTANPDSISYLIWGPRWSAYQSDGAPKDSADTMRVYTDRWFEPTRIVDAYGSTTTLFRLNGTYPTLVTRLDDPLGRVQTAVYDKRGNDSVLTDFGYYINNQFATTQYFADSLFGFDTLIVSPAHDSIHNTLDGYGNITVHTLGHSPHVTTLAYSDACGLVSSITEPQTAASNYQYDPVLCDPSAVQSPRGYWTVFYMDSIGRDTLDLTPIDSSDKTLAPSTSYARDSVRHVFDIMDREYETQTFGPALNGAEAQTMSMLRAFDPNGNVLTVKRWATPNDANIDTLRTVTIYDLANRPTV